MASNNNTHKKQKRTAVDSDVTVDGDSSSSPTTVPVIPSLSFGNVLHQFPDLFMQLLPYIADRTIFNAIASCSRDIHEKFKAIVPPWPNHYRLPASNSDSIAVWAQDGTRVAYTCRLIYTYNIGIVDQRHGIIHRIESNNRHGSFTDLKFSPDGRFLVSARDSGIVNLWNNVAGNNEQLQEWNIRDDFGEETLRIDISACSKYIVLAPYSSNRVILKSVENGETVKSLTPQPVMRNITKVIFSIDYRAIFVFGRCENSNVIKLWRSYLEETDEHRLITLWEHQLGSSSGTNIIPSHDKTMIAIQDTHLNMGWLLSIDNNYNCTVQELYLEESDVPVLLQFTSDDECIIYATKKRLKYWSVAERKFMDNGCLFYNRKTIDNLKVVNCSPNNRQLIVRANDKEGNSLYMNSIF